MSKYATSDIMKAIQAACPGAPVVLLHFNSDDDSGTADLAIAVDVCAAARAMRKVGNDLCATLQIPEEVDGSN